MLAVSLACEAGSKGFSSSAAGTRKTRTTHHALQPHEEEGESSTQLLPAPSHSTPEWSGTFPSRESTLGARSAKRTVYPTPSVPREKAEEHNSFPCPNCR